ncbi:MAG: dUTP diphosphatase [Ignavibacteriales bacterium]|nr:dUTP diphosphatase [Ignavibacteriales bacterium]
MIFIKVKRISQDFSDIPLPKYATEGSSGMDIRAAVSEKIEILPNKFTVVPTNLIFEIPNGYEIQVRPRSGLAANNGIGILNSPGTIDSDYRGELKVILFNFSDKAFAINRGDRIAQIVINKIFKSNLEEVTDISKTERGEGGFGHSGKH